MKNTPLFDTYFNDIFYSTKSCHIPTEVVELKDKYTVKYLLPEVLREDIDIKIENNYLIVEGIRKSTADEILTSNIFYGTLKSNIYFPKVSNINLNNIDATLKEGVLYLVILKTKDTYPKIKIK